MTPTVLNHIAVEAAPYKTKMYRAMLLCGVLLGAVLLVSFILEAHNEYVSITVGEQITIHFGDTYKVMHIEALHPFTEVRWSVTDAQLIAPGLTRTNEWIGTTIVFQLTPQSGKVTQLQLEHVGLTPQIECYEICSQGWNQFLGSLKTYVETGKGSPYVEQPTA